MILAIIWLVWLQEYAKLIKAGATQLHPVYVSTSSSALEYTTAMYLFISVHDCGSLSVPADNLGGLIVNFTTTIYNSTANYTCTDIGFVLIGVQQRECGADGTWTDAEPHCERKKLLLTHTCKFKYSSTAVPLSLNGTDITPFSFYLTWLSS